ncbi:MAG: glycine betaine ABC transporter substrate-binding protein [Acidimicrobiia bacterium]
MTSPNTLGRGLRLVALLSALILVLAACGGDDEEAGGSGGGELAGEQYDLSGIDIAVGSKQFGEQLVLGEIMVAAFEEAGANVENRVNTGGTEVVRSALENGDIDVYMEYNGTGWSVHLAQPLADISNEPEALTEAVRELDLEQTGIQWLGRSPFNNTYGFAVGPQLADELGTELDFVGMAEYLQENPDATVCMETEYPNRDDGLVLWEQHTGYQIPEDQIEILDFGVIYAETAEGECDFGEVYTTDGRISFLELDVVDDPGVNILYNVSMTIRDDKYQEAPEAFTNIAEAILAPLDNDTMASLNEQLDVQGEDAADVAREFLIEQGLIGG